MGLVLLLHIGFVIFVVGPASHELDWVFSVGKVTRQVIVEKLRAVITFESPQRKGKGLFDMTDLPKYTCLSCASDGSLLAPSGICVVHNMSQ